MIHCFEALQLDRVSQIIWFKMGIKSAFRESFESEQDLKARIANNLSQNRTSKCVSRIIQFRAGLKSAYRESFNSERDLKVRIANHSIQSGT